MPDIPDIFGVNTVDSGYTPTYEESRIALKLAENARHRICLCLMHARKIVRSHVFTQ